MPLPLEQHQNTTSEYTLCKTDTCRGMIKHMLGCLGKVPPDRSLFNMSDYIIQQNLPLIVNEVELATWLGLRFLIKLKTELCSKLRELLYTKVFSKHVSGIVRPFNEHDFYLFIFYALSCIMMAYVNVLSASLLHRIRSNEDWTLIVFIDRNCF